MMEDHPVTLNAAGMGSNLYKFILIVSVGLGLPQQVVVCVFKPMFLSQNVQKPIS